MLSCCAVVGSFVVCGLIGGCLVCRWVEFGVLGACCFSRLCCWVGVLVFSRVVIKCGSRDHPFLLQ